MGYSVCCKRHTYRPKSLRESLSGAMDGCSVSSLIAVALPDCSAVVDETACSSVVTCISLVAGGDILLSNIFPQLVKGLPQKDSLSAWSSRHCLTLSRASGSVILSSRPSALFPSCVFPSHLAPLLIIFIAISGRSYSIACKTSVWLEFRWV